MGNKGQRKAPVNSESSLAAEIGNRGGFQGLPERLERYSVAHARALEMRDYLQDAEGLEREYQRLSTCGEYLLFRYFYNIDSLKLAAMHSCKLHLLCPLCAIRRGSKLLTAYLGKFAQLALHHPDLVPVFFTLTVKDGEDLKERHKHLTKGWQKYRERARHALAARPGYAINQVCRMAGAVWSVEAKQGKNSGLWHPHIHGFSLCTSSLDNEALSREWRDITGDSFIVESHPVYGDPVEAFLEIFKYAVKFSDMPLGPNLEAYEVLRGRRLVDSFGVFRGVEVPEDLEDDMTGLDDLPYSEMLFRYVQGAGYALQHTDWCRRVA